MRAVPVPNDDETGEDEDRMVADPLVEATDDLWNNTARKNREIFTEIFRPVPTNLIRSWGDYEVSVFLQASLPAVRQLLILVVGAS